MGLRKMVLNLQSEKGYLSVGHKPKGKVLFIATVYTHLAAFHIPFMKLLQDRGFEVHAAASPAEGRREDVEKTGVVCYDIPFARSPYNPDNFQAFLRLRRLLKDNYFDLIHVHTPVAAFLGRFLAKVMHQGQVLYSAHGFHFFQGAPIKNWLIYYSLERLAARWTDGLIVMNREDYENAKRLGFMPGESLFLVHGVGVELGQSLPTQKTWNSVRSELGIGSDEVVITCVAELNGNKNHNFLLDAWRVLMERNVHAHLLLVGIGEQMEFLRERVNKEKLHQVHFMGYRLDVLQILAETDIVTLVSKREGLPKCDMEAMSCSRPVIASNVRGNRDLVDDARTGILVELGDLAGLVQAFEKLISDPELREAMGNAGREKIHDYSLDKILVEMADVYDRYLIKD